DALEKSTGTKIRVSLIAGIACARDVSLRPVETEAPLRRPILREEIFSPTASADALPELFMVQVSLSGRLFAPRELAIIGHILPSVLRHFTSFLTGDGSRWDNTWYLPNPH